MQEKASASLTATNTILSSLDLDAVNTSNRVAELMNELRSLIDERERKLLEQVETYRKEQEKKLLAEKENLEYRLESMKHCAEYSNHLLHHGNLVEISSTSKAVLSRLSTLLSSSIPPPQQTKEPPLQFKDTNKKKRKQEVQTALSSLGEIISLDSRSSSLFTSSSSSSSSSSAPNISNVGKPILQIGSSGKRDLQFDGPSGMAVDDGDRIFVADTKNNRIQCLDCDGRFDFKFGSAGKKEGNFTRPNDVAFDSKNQRILVADSGNHRIQAFDLEGTFLFTFGEYGVENGEFKEPRGIAIDKFGNIYVSDHFNHRVQVFDEKGKFVRQFGSSQDHLENPLGIGILPDGNVVVVDNENNRLAVFTSLGKFVGFIGEKKLKNPQWLLVYSDKILVADDPVGRVKSIAAFSEEGTFLNYVSQGAFKWVCSIAINSVGKIFVSGEGKDDEHHIFLF